METFSIICHSQKVWNDRNIVHSIVFWGRTAADDVGKASSCLLWDSVKNRWSWSRGCGPFLSFVFSVDACFVFSFVFYLWVNSGNIIHWQTRHTGLFQTPRLRSCPLSTNRKILLISLTKYAISGQSDTETNPLPDLYVFVWIRFQINYFCFSEKYANVIHRQGTTNYKVCGWDFRGEK